MTNNVHGLRKSIFSTLASREVVVYRHGYGVFSGCLERLGDGWLAYGFTDTIVVGVPNIVCNFTVFRHAFRGRKCYVLTYNNLTF